MHKLVVVLRRSDDDEQVERRWSEDFVPLAEKMPGLRGVVVGRSLGAPGGPSSVLLVHELLFDDLPALRAAMMSGAGQAAGRALMQFAGTLAELFFAEHHEMKLDAPAGSGG